jgi:hypothetical protein
MSDKPLARWIIGPTNERGFSCLLHSIRLFKQLYPELDLMVCHNQIGRDRLLLLEKLGVELFEQSSSEVLHGAIPLAGYNVHWKLYPPRLRLNAHEIIIDNDLVIYKRIPELDLFLTQDSTLLCQGLRGLHGSFAPYVPKGLQINSGLFGMPPGFDFHEFSKPFIDKKITWNNRFDEQGLVAATLLRYPSKIIISMITIPVLEPGFDIAAITTEFCCGYHFVSLNYGQSHAAWEHYRRRIRCEPKIF